MFGARFDDAIAGRSFVLVDPVDELIAYSIEEVIPTINRASQASRDGMWVGGYIAYEAAPAFDDSLAAHSIEGEPLAWFGVFGSVATEDDGPPDVSVLSGAPYSVSGWTPSLAIDEYREAFQAVRDHIEQGDTYQVNLTFPLTAAFSGSAESFYRDLIAAQRPAYGSLIRHGDRHLVSSSPERFFTISDGRIVTSPMKGTARRGRWPEEDDLARTALIESEKDRAENLMIVDLVRNDLGRVASFGTVNVDELFAVEGYRTVWQMTSTISATLRPSTSLADVFGALFPCGSVTGAPKGSSMRIIADLEDAPRGVYCGAIGFIPPGDGIDGASFSVAIRTAVVDESEGLATFGVGGGLTWYSEPDAEYDETVTKALVLARRPEPFGLIETIRWDPALEDPWLFLDAHLDRLASSADFHGIPVDRAEVRSELDRAVVDRTSPGRVRVVVSADGTQVTVDDIEGRFADGPGPEADVVGLVIDPTPIDRTDPAMFHKTTNRVAYSMRAARHPEADDVVLVNDLGQITETTVANVAVRLNDVWVTPPREDGLLAGVMREHLIRSGRIKERSVSIDDLLRAEAVAVFNSVRGWRTAAIQHGVS